MKSTLADHHQNIRLRRQYPERRRRNRHSDVISSGYRGPKLSHMEDNGYPAEPEDGAVPCFRSGRVMIHPKTGACEHAGSRVDSVVAGI